MKKTLKKFTAVLLAVLMFMSLMSLQSFAAFDSLRLPSPAGAELIDADKIEPVSLKAVGQYFEQRDEFLGDLYESFAEEITYEEFLSMLEGMSVFNYSDLPEMKYKLTLSNGKTYDAENTSYISDGIVAVSISSFITKSAVEAALERKDGTVDLTVFVTVYNAILDSVEPKEEKYTVKIPAVECFVESIEPISPLPDKIYEYCDYPPAGGCEFLIKYGDGTQKTAKIKEKDTVVTEGYSAGQVFRTYELDGKPIVISESFEYDENDEISKAYLVFSFQDAYYENEIEYLEGDPFEKLEITDYTITADKGFTSVSYDLYYENGTKQSFTNEISVTVEEINGGFYEYINIVDGFYVYVCEYPDAENYTEKDGHITLCLGAGETEDYVQFEAPDGIYEGEGEQTATGIIGIIQRIISFFKNIIAKIFK